MLRALPTEAEWRRAYDEVVAFESTLAGEGMVLVKFWMHISEAEQLRRYRARERDPLKRWKLTDEDWRNLAHRASYERAAEEMLQSDRSRPVSMAADRRREQTVRSGRGL